MSDPVKVSRRAVLGWAGAGLVAAVAPRPVFAKEGCGDMALGTPSAAGPGNKYDTDGKALRFPGNTILCHLNSPGPTFDALVEISAQLRAGAGDAHIAWTPPSSYHMTVFDGCLDSRRLPGDWPQMLPLDASLQRCNRYLGSRLRKFDLDMELPIRMVADESLATKTSTQFLLRPIDDAENRRLRRLRDRLSEATGVRHANHDSYGFHVTFGYYIKQFAPVDERRYQALWTQSMQELRRRVPVIELGAPEYCLFDTMDEFEVQFLLANRSR